MSSKIAVALSGAACALALHALPARAQDYEMLWGPPRAYPSAVMSPWRDGAPAFGRSRRAERRSYFGPFGRRARSRAVSSEPARRRSRDGDEGGARSKPRLSHAGGGAYRTLCVRSCDGYYWPISYATPATRFKDDEKVCKANCPNQKVALYTHRTDHEGSDDAVSLKGKPISELKNAFLYRQEYKPECTCKMPQPLVASTHGPKRHAKAGAGSSAAGSERKGRKESSAAAHKAGADPAATSSIERKSEPEKSVGQANAPAEADKSDPKRRVRMIGPRFLVD